MIIETTEEFLHIYKHFLDNGIDKVICKEINYALKQNNYGACFLYAVMLKDYPVFFNVLQDVVIYGKDAMLCVELANVSVFSNKKKLENAVIEIGDAQACVKFARDVKYCNLKALGKVIDKNGTEEDKAYFGYIKQLKNNNNSKNLVL